MKTCEFCRSGRIYLALAASATVIALLCILGLWLHFKSSSELDGRYSTAGQMQLSSGKVIDMVHTILFKNGQFYAMTKQDNAILETSGYVEYGLLRHYRLHVKEGNVTALTGDTDNELVFNLMYGHHRGSIINLVPFGDCLYGLETRQVYCASKQSGSL